VHGIRTVGASASRAKWNNPRNDVHPVSADSPSTCLIFNLARQGVYCGSSVRVRYAVQKRLQGRRVRRSKIYTTTGETRCA
jgi:hypothetical protein